MTPPRQAPPQKPARPAAAHGAEDVEAVIASLKGLATAHTRDGMARYGLPSDKAFGVSVGDTKQLARQLGRSHELALALWDTGWYEARLLASFVDEPERVTPEQMDRWCSEFDNWGVCDTVCFSLFDRTPFAYGKVEEWSLRRGEFARRAAFALLACLGRHDEHAADAQFERFLPTIEEAASDDRNFVKKAVSWALRVIGERSAGLNLAAIELARRLESSPEPSARWVGSDTLRELDRPAVKKRLARRTTTAPGGTPPRCR